jgi:hypothetical protein
MHQLIIVLLLVFVVSCSEELPAENTNVPDSKTDTTSVDSSSQTLVDTTASTPIIEDTIFIKRELTEKVYHAIYIEKDSANKRFQWLTDFTFDEFDSSALKGNREHMREKLPDRFGRVDLHGLPNDWLPLYLYKNDYYLYAPSDWGNAGKRIVTDSSLIYWYMDGPYAMPFQSSKKVSDRKYVFTFNNPWDDDNHLNQLIITIIDPVTKMSVWEFSDEKRLHRYRIYVPKSSAHHFDLIVNYCNNMKQLEYDFEEVDYEAFLKPFKGKTNDK